MKVLLCQNNLVGFLSAFYESRHVETDAELILATHSQRDLLNVYYEVPEDVKKAQSVRAEILKKGGRKVFNELLNASRSNHPQKEEIMFEYLKLFFERGSGIHEAFDNLIVIEFNQLTSRVLKEAHRLSAFVRLQEMSNGVFYGFFSSDNDILELLAPEYISRFHTQMFVLHDFKRKKMAIYDGKKTHYAMAPDKIEITLSENETLFQKLWKDYHKNVSIAERENLTLQRSFAPKKYRHFMHEF